jgi:hypothetical protein
MRRLHPSGQRVISYNRAKEKYQDELMKKLSIHKADTPDTYRCYY